MNDAQQSSTDETTDQPGRRAGRWLPRLPWRRTAGERPASGAAPDPGPVGLDKPADGPWPAVRDGLREFGIALTTPAAAGRAPLAQAHKGWVRATPYVVVFAFVAALLPTTVTVLIQDYGMNGGMAGGLAVAQTLPLLLALTRPLHAWWVIFPADVIGGLALYAGKHVDGRSWPWTPMIIVGYVLLMVLLGLRESRRTLIAIFLVTAAAGVFFEQLSQTYSDGSWVLMLVLAGVTLVVTYALRLRGEAQAKLAEQETISEAERAQRTLLEERARIARELHDIVAHHMSVITVQADTAKYRLPGLSPEVEKEFGEIAAAARESLTEMRRLLKVLRNEEAQAERTPQPGLNRLHQLVEATRRAGVQVAMTPAEAHLQELVTGVPPAVDLSAYRIVQEALSNVIRHAPGAVAHVELDVHQRELLLSIVNGPAQKPRSALETSGTGHGLVGMRERVRLTGGSLEAGPAAGGGFRVEARIPLHEQDGEGEPPAENTSRPAQDTPQSEQDTRQSEQDT
ncbi:sensor histidine kinase [Streptomyces sp. YC504]|uniref:histidine kinase n=1 Tax=Streptomyces mesophilus TaxID=1775132 RepID=A0A6G4XV38_9ACTN|nr:sensor histidine kinase [Streptomyces mesophilus]NGO80471.1 sensor histidine kinase [Streptomyces mesophilus]